MKNTEQCELGDELDCIHTKQSFLNFRSVFTASLPVDKTSCDGNSNIEIAPTSLVWNGSAAVAKS